jgi:hypothetical protein
VPVHFIERDAILAPVVELGGARHAPPIWRAFSSVPPFSRFQVVAGVQGADIRHALPAAILQEGKE